MQQFFWKISGGDVTIIPYCAAITKRTFFWLGILVFIIFLTTILGFYYSFIQIFELVSVDPNENGNLEEFATDIKESNNAIGFIITFFLALFFALVINNIYLLIISTFTKSKLPVKKQKRSMIFSLVIRFGFLVFIGMFVSKPLELAVTGSKIENDISWFKKTEIQKLQEKNSAVMIDRNAKRALQEKILQASYFAKKVWIISTQREYIWTWFFSLFIVLLYISPALIKMLIPASSWYYARMGNIEQTIIDKHYVQLKLEYAAIMKERCGNPVELSEAFVDPPYNTIRKTDERLVKTKKDFLDLFKPFTTK